MTRKGYRQTREHVEKRITPRRLPVTVERLNAWSYRAGNGCLVWTGERNRGGYGQIRDGGPKVPVHVAAWRLLVGPVPEGKKVLHRCDNPPCWEVSHLWIGTQKDNVADMWAKGRAGDHRSRPRPWQRKIR